MYYTARIAIARPQSSLAAFVNKLVALNETYRQHCALSRLTSDQLADIGLSKTEARAEYRKFG